MERTFDKIVDNFFEGIAPQIIIGNVILGTILFLIGLIIMVKKSPNKKLKTMGLIFLGVGAVSIINGAIQMGIFS
ncbi:hypothetical protein [Cytobacillus sp.]|uniref:hypothetical protein n=1 Tax=Cytobacillus sp. TaxID=2675269 RepID=UPI0028BD7AFC|nr:hypothetical protein [Cytobacillus sp.]